MPGARTSHLLCTLVFGACGGPTESDTLQGQHVLQLVDGVALPASFPGTGSCDVTLTTGRLVIDAADGFALHLDGATDCTQSGGGIQQIGAVLTGSYTRAGADLAFTAPRFQAAPYQFAGRVSDTQIDVTLPDDFDGAFPVRECRFAR